MARLGILGGTFDPPHAAHIAMAEAALETLDLDRVLLVPAPVPPHKRRIGITSYADRFEMVRAAVSGHPGLEASRLDEGRDGPSYTVDLLREMSRGGDELYFILGADSLRDLGTWKEPAVVLSLATLVVFPRPGVEMRLAGDDPASVVVFDSPIIDVSSSSIRETIASGGDPGTAISPDVASFIRRRGLYRG